MPRRFHSKRHIVVQNAFKTAYLMLKKRIIGILREGEAGEDGRRVPQTGNQQRNFLQVEGQVRGLEVYDAKRLKALQDENANLKKLLAEAMLDRAMLKDIAS